MWHPTTIFAHVGYNQARRVSPGGVFFDRGPCQRRKNSIFNRVVCVPAAFCLPGQKEIGLAHPTNIGLQRVAFRTARNPHSHGNVSPADPRIQTFPDLKGYPMFCGSDLIWLQLVSITKNSSGHLCHHTNILKSRRYSGVVPFGNGSRTGLPA